MADTATKEHAHELIERLDPERVPVVVDWLEKMLDPVSLAQANAPLEDEQISAEEELAVARVKAETSPGSSMEDVLAEFGLTLEELRRMDFPASGSHEKNARQCVNALSGGTRRGPIFERSTERLLCAFCIGWIVFH
jgi:hypothetical protein